MFKEIHAELSKLSDTQLFRVLLDIYKQDAKRMEFIEKKNKLLDRKCKLLEALNDEYKRELKILQSKEDSKHE